MLLLLDYIGSESLFEWSALGIVRKLNFLQSAVFPVNDCDMPEKNVIPKMYCESLAVCAAAYCWSQIFCQQLIFLNIKKQVTTIEFILSAENVLFCIFIKIHTHTSPSLNPLSKYSSAAAYTHIIKIFPRLFFSALFFEDINM